MRWLAVLILMVSTAAHARIFNYKDAAVAPFIRGTAGMAQLNQDAFANEPGSGTSVSGASKYNYGAELGFAFAIGANARMRIGAEIFNDAPVNGSGTDSSGTQRYTLNSTVFVFNPNVTLEYDYKTHGNTRFFAFGGAGYAMISAANKYTMTAAGTTALGTGDFTESMSANDISYQAGWGLETLFTDNVTFMFDVGYRYLPVKNLSYSSDTPNFMGAQTKGSPVLNQDGSKRTLNLSGPVVAAGFRFYLNFL
jgi:opacity protein-like surface antigen